MAGDYGESKSIEERYARFALAGPARPDVGVNRKKFVVPDGNDEEVDWEERDPINRGEEWNLRPTEDAVDARFGGRKRGNHELSPDRTTEVRLNWTSLPDRVWNGIATAAERMDKTVDKYVEDIWSDPDVRMSVEAGKRGSRTDSRIRIESGMGNLVMSTAQFEGMLRGKDYWGVDYDKKVKLLDPGVEAYGQQRNDFEKSMANLRINGKSFGAKEQYVGGWR